MSNYPERCQHIKINGVQCGAPALRRNRFCFFHKRFQDERIRIATDNTRARASASTFTLPVLEDANSIQIALMEVMRLILARKIEHKTASLLLYALQTASTNLRRTTFSTNKHDVILDPRDAAITPLDYRAWEDEEFDQEDEDEEEEGEEDEEEEEEEEEEDDDEEEGEDDHEEEEEDEEENDGKPTIAFAQVMGGNTGTRL